MGSPPVQGSPVSAAAHGWGKARPERDQGGLRRQQSGPEKPQRCTHMSQSAAATHPSLLRPEPPTETLPLTQAPGPSKLWPQCCLSPSPRRHGTRTQQAAGREASLLISALSTGQSDGGKGHDIFHLLSNGSENNHVCTCIYTHVHTYTYALGAGRVGVRQMRQNANREVWAEDAQGSLH